MQRPAAYVVDELETVRRPVGIAAGFRNDSAALGEEGVFRRLIIQRHGFCLADAAYVVGEADVQSRALCPGELPPAGPCEGGPVMPAGGVALVIVSDGVAVDRRQEISPLGVSVGECGRLRHVTLSVGAAADVAQGVVDVGELMGHRRPP